MLNNIHTEYRLEIFISRHSMYCVAPCTVNVTLGFLCVQNHMWYVSLLHESS